MTCSHDLIEAYMDEELDPGLRANVEQHLATCSACSEVHSRLMRQKAAIKLEAHYYTAPAGLEQSIRTALRRELKQAGTERQMPWRWMAIAASMLLAVSVAWNVRQLQPRTPANNLVAETIVADHIRSLIGTHLLDVVSTDQHTVKPWFNGKLDFSPDVKDFVSEGFPLIGGRLDYLDNRTVAALIYQRRQHIINVFTWPSGPEPELPRQPSRNGYNIVHWTRGVMTYWAVSDVSATDLELFKSYYQK